MRTRNEIRENGFVVARQYLADAGARDRAIGPVYQLHLDAIDLLAALAEKDAEIERLRNIARLAGNLTDRLAEVNEATSNTQAFVAAMQYGKETAALAFALTEVGE